MITILDFYVDEPACLGVPPYFSPYPRYIAGSLVHVGVPLEKINYQTVDRWRIEKSSIPESEMVIVVAGFTVPGKYLGGKIGTVSELLQFLEIRTTDNQSGITLVGGPIRFAQASILENISKAGGILIDGDLELAVHTMVSYSSLSGLNTSRIRNQSAGKPVVTGFRSNSQIGKWAVAGAFITKLHPNYPYLINELETYRGCTRTQKCSFCTEVFYGKPCFRDQHDVIGEVKALYQQGNRYFRLGRQADLLTYKADDANFQSGFPAPQSKEIEKLYSGIRDVAPDLKMLHLDNINPGLIATYPGEALKALKIIARYNTPGDTAAMGLESVDETVYRINRLKCTRDEAMRAVELVNEAGAERVNGIPKLLPGLNFIHGLPGESDQTFKQNYEFLLDVLSAGLMLRRINIRQIAVHKSTRVETLLGSADELKAAGFSGKKSKPALLEKKFVYYRDKIRQEIDRAMLERVFPKGTILKELIPEASNLGYIFGRQLGSYPVTVKIPNSDPKADQSLGKKSPINVMITGYKERSILGITHPIQINRLGHKALAQLPGVGKKRATTIFMNRPLVNFGQLQSLIDGPIWGEPKDYDFSKAKQESKSQ